MIRVTPQRRATPVVRAPELNVRVCVQRDARVSSRVSVRLCLRVHVRVAVR